MNTKDIQAHAETLWDSYCEIFPELVKFDCPTIKINNRFTKTGACNHTEDNIVELGGKFLAKFPNRMMRVILPHEMAHQIDYNLNGWHYRKVHHGKQWIEIMVKIGQKPDQYHTMVL